MFRLLKLSTLLGLGLLAVALAVGLMASGGLRTTHAQVIGVTQPPPSLDCIGVTPEETCINVFPEFAENDVGTEHTVTASVSADFEPDAVGELVAFTVTEGPNFETQGTCSPNADCTTDEFGEVSFTYTGGADAGFDTIEACIFGGDLCVEAGKQWVTHRLSLTPETATNIVGTTHKVTATLTDLDGKPTEGFGVFIRVVDGPNEAGFDCEEEACVSDVTDDLGQVKLTYTSDGRTGTDGIFAQVCIAGEVRCTVFLFAEATKTWVEPPPTITLTPETATNEVGTNHTVTATVTDEPGGVGVPDVKVFFTVLTSGPNAGATGTCSPNADCTTDDPSGQVNFTYTGDGGAGTDTIQACFTPPTVEGAVEPPGVGDIGVVALPVTRIECATAEKTWAVVLPVGNAPPVADDKTVTTTKDTAVTISLSGSDVDGCDSTTFSFTVTGGPSNGSLDNTSGSVTCSGNGSLAANVKYTPKAGFGGKDTFTYTISDGTDTDTATVTINIVAAQPDTGGAPSNSGTSALPWLTAIGGAFALMGVVSGLWLAHQRRRVR